MSIDWQKADNLGCAALALSPVALLLWAHWSDSRWETSDYQLESLTASIGAISCENANAKVVEKTESGFAFQDYYQVTSITGSPECLTSIAERARRAGFRSDPDGNAINDLVRRERPGFTEHLKIDTTRQEAIWTRSQI